MKQETILCPVCGNKTRDRMREDTELRTFPLFCPNCKRESLIDVKDMKVRVGAFVDEYTGSNTCRDKK